MSSYLCQSSHRLWTLFDITTGAREVFKSIVWSVVFRRGSMLQLDQMLRLKGGRNAIGVEGISDTTIYRFTTYLNLR